MKLLSIAIPCYNSEAYMRNCIESLLPGGDEVEILIVDDGSVKDNTAQIAPKKQATITHTMAMPPLLCPTQVLTNLIRRLEIPAFAMMLPDSTKNGMASSRNLLMPEYMLVATIVKDVPE